MRIVNQAFESVNEKYATVKAGLTSFVATSRALDHFYFYFVVRRYFSSYFFHNRLCRSFNSTARP